MCIRDSDSNVAQRKGGVLCLLLSRATVTKSLFHHNRAKKYGGVLYTNKPTMTIYLSRFWNNTSYRVYSISGNDVRIIGCEFYNNTVQLIGGVMIIRSSHLSIDRSLFLNSAAQRSSGVLYAANQSTITINDTKYSNNTAGTGGGVINVESGTKVRISNSHFNSNFAGNAAVLLIQLEACLLYTSPSPRDATLSRMPSSA